MGESVSSFNKKVIVFLADGCEEIEALTVVDLLRRAGIPVTEVSIAEGLTVTSSHGVRITADAMIDDIDFDEYDGLVLPGGMPGTVHEAECEPLLAAVKKFHADGREVCAICAAPTILADLGLLEGKEATCFPSREKDMKGAVLTHAPATETGNIITGRAMGCTIPFALKIIEHYLGREAAVRIADAIVYSGTF